MTSAELAVALGLPQGAQSEEWRVVPATVALNAVLIDTAELFVFVPALRVYPAGFRFTLNALLRPTASERAARDFADDGVILGPPAPDTQEQAVWSLRLGIRFADGSRAVLDRNRMRPSVRTGLGALQSIGHGRSSSARDVFAWGINVFGIPKDGSVLLYHQWLAFGAPEASRVIDGDALRSAAARAVELWPDPTLELDPESDPDPDPDPTQDEGPSAD